VGPWTTQSNNHRERFRCCRRCSQTQSFSRTLQTVPRVANQPRNRLSLALLLLARLLPDVGRGVARLTTGRASCSGRLIRPHLDPPASQRLSPSRAETARTLSAVSSEVSVSKRPICLNRWPPSPATCPSHQRALPSGEIDCLSLTKDKL